MTSSSVELCKQYNLVDLLKLIRRSIISDYKKYQSINRPISFPRLLSLLTPNLKRPIFIVGAPRSGTTFLGECIAQLPEVSYHFEPIANKVAARYIYEELWDFSKSSWFYKTAYAWMMRSHFDSDLRFAEKTPQNCFLIDFLRQTFPDAQFIHIIRDGRDSALSYSKKPWLQAAQSNSGKFEPGGYPYGAYARFWVERDRVQEFESTSDIHRCIWAWRRFTEKALESASCLSATQYHELRYEALIENPSFETTRLLKFLDITDPISQSLFQTNLITSVNSSSVNQWRNELSQEQILQIEAEAGQLLQKLGY
jgi:Sulfotransferase family